VTAVKICGITRLEDAAAAAEWGASYVGFVLWPNSPRAATLDVVQTIVATLPVHVTPVGVFVNPTAGEISTAADAGIKLAQVHGSNGGTVHDARIPIVHAVHLTGDGIDPAVTDDLILLDAHDPVKHGGTGKTVDWSRAAIVAKTRRVILAGGLTPENVAQAIHIVQPFAVDVASGVESSPGIKDHRRLRAFLQSAQGTEAPQAP